jgi:phosphoribosyl 1,2-cyclic phosphodiesterase
VTVDVHLFGVRGSRPAPGPEFAAFGGHTSCVAIGRDGETPGLLLDAGSGLVRFAALLDGLPFRGTILLGHLHWDHTHGLPFFSPGDHPDAEVDLFMPAQGEPAEVLARAMSPPHFPIGPDGLRGSWAFHALEPGTFEVEGLGITALEIPHKGGRTYGYRVSDGTRAVAYLSDHNPSVLGSGPGGFGPYHEAALRLADGVDLLIHDAQYTAEEYEVLRHNGHSTPDYAVGLAEASGARRVLLFHHDPQRRDTELARLAEEFESDTVTVAREGSTLRV